MAIPIPSNVTDRLVTFHAVCLNVDPQRWRGESRVGGQVLVATGKLMDYWQAGKAPESLFVGRLIELFTGGEPPVGDATS